VLNDKKKTFAGKITKRVVAFRNLMPGVYVRLLFQNELKTNEKLIDKMRETIEWGEETLLAWNNDLSKRNTDVNILETYNLMDNNKFKVNVRVHYNRSSKW